MAELLVFTLLAAIAAAYPVLPEHRQLRVRYNLWTKPRLGFITLMIGVILATYAVSVSLQNIDPNTLRVSVLNRTVTVTPLGVELVQLSAVVGIVILFAAVFLKSQVRIRNEQNFLEILRELYNREEYTTLVDIIHNNYEPLIKHPEKPRHPDSIVVNRRILWDDEYDPPEGLNKWIHEKKQLLEYYYNWFWYRADNTAEDASEYTELLLLNPKFVELYSGVASELGLQIVRDDDLQKFPRKKVVHRYLQTQLETDNSILRRDLEQNTGIDSIYRYKIEKENRLIHALLSDFDRAEDLDVYKPIGDKTREIIRDQRREEFDEYNDQSLTEMRMSDDYVFRDPVFSGIQFFNLLVTEAFSQKVDWHVWLSYYESFTREICRNYEMTKYSDPNAEFPNDYSRLLYEIISNLRDWIKMMEEELKPDVDNHWSGPPYVTDISPEDGDDAESSADDETDAETELSKEDNSGEDEPKEEDDQEDTQRHGKYVQLGRISTGRGQRNIPEMTVIILISCHKEILSTEDIPTQFKAYISEIVFMCLLNLRKYDEGSLQWEYSELMLHCLEQNLTGRRADPAYQKYLKQVYFGHYGDSYDYGVRHEVSVKDTQMTGIVEDLDELIDS